MKTKLDAVTPRECRLQSTDCVNSPLRYSHIIPEFLYRPGYDEKGRAVAFGGDEPIQYLQKGFRYPLLCDGCEGFLNDHYEKAFKRLWIDKPPVPSICFRDEYKITLKEPQVVRLFLLSVLWRAAVCPVNPFAKVNLPIDDEERLAEMLRRRDAGSFFDYPIFAVLPKLPDSRRVEPMVITPFVDKFMGVTTVLFGFGGCLWNFMMTRGTERVPFRPWIMTEDGRMRIQANDSRNVPGIQKLVSRHFRNAEENGWVEPWNK